MLNISVLVSGGGTNLQALIDAQKNGIIKNGRIVRVIASRDGVYALERARQNSIETRIVSRKNYAQPADFDHALLKELKDAKTDLIVLAGFLSILGDEVLSEYENRIINIHPSLIPSFCGAGYYGLRVHKEALKYGVKVTGATVHFVSKIVDGGAIIAQKAVAVEDGDTPEILQKRVMEQAEWVLLPHAVSLFCEGRIKVENGKTVIEK
ncbi:MAG TPA: phosphoribosylglycinamide formyltransferase [Ruminiclostridium sp.]|nr:phosphoribosylglycinamide formyltransferase [Ruminiclostridium sp.]